ncbi:MAG: filamentous hemagglutinin N-terminal domain-containing protein [Symploca sp. SIO2B6]|nr:filamentous hemagglutinin N-terminal domain-containing protein [Symploca sp. SIO2B6]
MVNYLVKPVSWLMVSLCSFTVEPLNLAKAQILPDDTLGTTEMSVLTPEIIGDFSAIQIEGGAIRGENLFHSFREFNIGEARAVYFTHAAGIENIISRVTGSNLSNIEGTLGVLGNANLFLINPNGIIFGANARLDMGGSFIATTASSLVFENNLEFSTTNQNTIPLLTINTPIGLQFGEAVGNIINRSELLDGMQVQPNQTLALLGGNIFLEGGNLFAPGGRIELGSAASNNFVGLVLAPDGLIFNYEGVQNFQDIQLSDEANITVASPFLSASIPVVNAGEVRLLGRQLIITGDSAITANNFGANSGGILTFVASESLEISNESNLANNNFSEIGAGGEIKIETRQLIVRKSSIRAATFSAGSGGNIIINASESILVDGSGGFSRLSTESFSEGKAGNLQIMTGRLIINNGGQLTSTTRSSGEGGSLLVNASEIVKISGQSSTDTAPSGLFAATRGVGSGGLIKVNTSSLVVEDGAQISVSSTGEGAAGNLEVNTNNLRLENQGTLSAETASGEGNITIQAEDIFLRRNSTITTNATGLANGGNISIDTDLIVAAPEENNDLVANAVEGSGGQITLTAQGIIGLELRTIEDLERLLGTNNPNNLDPNLLTSNDITAFSQFNPEIDQGSVILQTPEVDPSQGLVVLPNEIRDPSELIATTCPADEGNYFAVIGRGGLPEDPRQPLISDMIWLDTRDFSEISDNLLSDIGQTAASKPPKKIVEATGWVVNEDNEVVLVAPLPGAAPQDWWYQGTGCSSF